MSLCSAVSSSDDDVDCPCALSDSPRALVAPGAVGSQSGAPGDPRAPIDPGRKRQYPQCNAVSAAPEPSRLGAAFYDCDGTRIASQPLAEQRAVARE